VRNDALEKHTRRFCAVSWQSKRPFAKTGSGQPLQNPELKENRCVCSAEIDGVNIAQLGLKQLRSAISMLPQVGNLVFLAPFFIK
jgi:hypothetical protein